MRVGLHTGKIANVTFIPASINHGIKFQRVDINDSPLIEANVDYVTSVERGTTISKKNVNISTIEHLLAAIVGLQIDNILIQIDTDEVEIILRYQINFYIKMKKIMSKLQHILIQIIE